MDPELSLRHLDQDLYELNARFYGEVRNPIFHGQQLTRVTILGMRAALLHIARLYEWIDCWCNPEDLLEKGGAAFAHVRPRDAGESPNHVQ